MTTELNLKGFSFQDLFSNTGLDRLDRDFLSYLDSQDSALKAQLLAYRKGGVESPTEVSEFLVACAPVLERFIAMLFGIEDAVARLEAVTQSDIPVFAFKKYFVLREARRKLANPPAEKFEALQAWLQAEILMHSKKGLHDPELSVALYAQHALQVVAADSVPHDRLIDWCVLAMTTPEGQAYVKDWPSFHLPKRLDYKHLVSVEGISTDDYGRLQGLPENFRLRDGFGLTDLRMNSREVQDEIHYCVYCHDKAGDFCSKGFPVKKGQPDLGFKVSATDEALTGCPLEEKISEMNWLKKQGLSIASLAVVMVDNPMCPATGHRICNDCMKACIYQKQEPVDIPQIETRVLSDVLGLPWGVEIYDLLTRWNPLRQTQYSPKPYNGLKVLVMGMGPAGFTLAHHLLMEGFAVVGADGLKLERLDSQLLTQPIRDFNRLVERLDERIMTGFGGVAEYGITVRWDKNFLKLIYISLLRRPHFQVFGSVRFGGTLTVDDVWALGFDHLGLAVGAGLPRELRIPNSLAPGMRQANDFLMALQLTGAAKRTSLANLQVRLPAVVIGGGLTGVDTATEVQAYYIAQVEKTLWRYETLIQAYGEAIIRETFDTNSLAILDEFLAHGREVRVLRAQADREGVTPNFIELIRSWGGVTIVYRRTMQESPAYKRNHEELEKAFEEGIYYAEGLDPEAVVLDETGYVSALRCSARFLDEEGRLRLSDDKVTLPARAIFVATGAQPNVAYEYEHRGTFHREGSAYARYRVENNVLQQVGEVAHIKEAEWGVFTSYERDHRRVSFVGDTHPVFHGSVVKAIASAKRSYPAIVESLADRFQDGSDSAYQSFHDKMKDYFESRVVSIKRHHKKVVELVVRSPAAVRNFNPGQFYRLQNYETTAQTVHETRLQTEALALLAIPHQEPDHLSFMVVENGVSSRLVSRFKPGEMISLMGPTGARTKIISENSEAILIVGGLYAIAYALSVGPMLREQGHRVCFVAVLDQEDELYCRDRVESVVDRLLYVKNVSGLNELLSREKTFPIAKVSAVHVIGESDLVRFIRDTDSLKALFAPEVSYTAAVYGPMQCMLKGVCAQCLQWQIDPETGERKKAVYACSWQHQPMEKIDIGNIDERLVQNRVQERLSGLWLDYLVSHEK